MRRELPPMQLIGSDEYWSDKQYTLPETAIVGALRDQLVDRINPSIARTIQERFAACTQEVAIEPITKGEKLIPFARDMNTLIHAVIDRRKIQNFPPRPRRQISSQSFNVRAQAMLEDTLYTGSAATCNIDRKVVYFLTSTSGHSLTGIPSNLVSKEGKLPKNNEVLPPLLVGRHYYDDRDGSQIRVVQANKLQLPSSYNNE